MENWKTNSKNWTTNYKYWKSVRKLENYKEKLETHPENWKTNFVYWKSIKNWKTIKKPETNIGKLVKESTEFHLVVTAQLNLNMSWSLT